MVPEKGRGFNRPVLVENLHVTTQGLRYLNLLQHHTIVVDYKDIKVRVPEPAAFTLHKLIISERRTREAKRIKDRSSAVINGSYISSKPEQCNRLIEIYNSLPNSWKKNFKTIN